MIRLFLQFTRLILGLYLLSAFALSSALPGKPGLAAGQTPSPPDNRILNVPILLYHHVGSADEKRFERYTVSLADFDQQMRSLKAWGYTTITLGDLSTALTEGTRLPPRPVILTFDDGYQDIYQNAFPLLKDLEFTATIFVIGRQIGIKGYLNKVELNELVEHGWQIGNHTYNHHSLIAPGTNLKLEIVTARKDLEDLLGIPVITFSFPYGLTNSYISRQVMKAGYTAAVGLGGSYHHREGSRYYFSRIEIKPDLNALEFMGLLPWAGPPGGRGIWNSLMQ